MRLLIVHNFYLLPGGEDQVYHSEINLLRAHGIDVHEFAVDNEQIAAMGKIKLGINTVWSRHSFLQMQGLLKEVKPDLVHFHNTFPLLSPSVYYACKSSDIPAIQTLHNYRMLCPSALLLRNGKPCKDCIGKFLPWPGIKYACYRNSYVATAGVGAMLAVHHVLGTWKKHVDCYLALTNFARQKFIEGGLPANKIMVKPNFVYPDPGSKQMKGGYALFVGRLSQEKGTKILLRAWSILERIPLRIVGEGPQRNEIEDYIQNQDMINIEVMGQVSREKVFSVIKNARFLVFPSNCYEGFGLAIVEAFACGVPVIASNRGAMAEIVDEGKTGLLFNPGDAEDLAAKVEWAWTHASKIVEMGKAARLEYEEKYTSERNYQLLIEIYHNVINNYQNRHNSHGY